MYTIAYQMDATEKETAGENPGRLYLASQTHAAQALGSGSIPPSGGVFFGLVFGIAVTLGVLP